MSCYYGNSNISERAVYGTSRTASVLLCDPLANQIGVFSCAVGGKINIYTELKE